MNFLVPIMMFGWIPAVIYLFRRFPAQHAIIISFITAWLFLPQAGYPLAGLPDYTKISATYYGVLLATLLYDVTRFSSFKFGWLDIPMLVWCVCPLASSISNDLGLYDGISATVAQTVTLGFPYFLGRIYLNNLAGLRKLAIGIFVGGLIYIPLCWFEFRMSPQLHRMVYGFAARGEGSFAQTVRYGGYRPTVFMDHGLAVGMWMMAATLVGIWLWKTQVIKQLWGIPVSWLVVALFITFVLVKSTGAYVYLALGIVILFLARWFGTALPLLLLIMGLSSYVYMGATGTFSGDQIVSFISQVDQERAQSLDVRFTNEKMLSEKARQQIIFGWGGWGRNRLYDQYGKDISVTDSLWIIEFGNHGLVGLICFTASLLLPVVSLCMLRYPASTWSHPKVAPVAVLSVVLTMYMLDCVLNAMFNPVFIFLSGGLSGIILQETGTKLVRHRGTARVLKPR
ncbi:MAG TPA: hypothetical protein V6D15_17305 [Oculatellaceae cyanobacterium]